MRKTKIFQANSPTHHIMAPLAPMAPPSFSPTPEETEEPILIQEVSFLAVIIEI